MKTKKIIILLATIIMLIVLLAACGCTHDWGDWEVTRTPSCTQAGEETRRCLKDDTHIEKRTKNALGHDWGDWVVTLPETDTQHGQETRVCKRDNTHFQTRILGTDVIIYPPVGQNEQVQPNAQGYIVTPAGLWLTESGEEYTVLAYSGKSKNVMIPAFVNDKPITVIGDGAYYYPCVEGYVPPIWTKFMFSGNTNITSVTFEEGSRIRHIGLLAFSDCTSLIEFETPNSLRSINENAFSDTGIWKETPNNSIVYVGNWAVGYKGTSSEDVKVRADTVGISSYAFMNTSFKQIFIPQSVKVVGSYAFYQSTLFNNAPDNSVVYADKWVVGHKGSLGAVTLESDTVGIADSAFLYAYSLTSIVIPSNVESIGENAFLLCKNLTDVTIEDGVKIIGDSAFLYCKALKSISIPQSVTDIGAAAFGDCRALTSASLPQGLTTINNGLFSGCILLENFTIPSSMTIIGINAFRGTALKNIVIPKGVVSIGADAFVANNQMENFSVETENQFYTSEDNCLIEIATAKLITGFNNTVIPDWIEHIEKNAFYGINISSVSIPDSILTIGDYAFYGCTNLQSVTFGSGVTEIGDYTFSNCAFTSIDLPSSLTKIGTFAFEKCPIESLVISHSVTYLGLGAFYKTSVKSVMIGNGDIQIGGWGVFAYCENLTSVVIPSNMKTIGRLMFWNCTSLSAVTIENGVTTIEDGAFTGCAALESIVIPASVIIIESNVFYACPVLTIYAEVEEKPDGWADNWNSNRSVVWDYKE